MPSPERTRIELNEESAVHHSPAPIGGGLLGGLGYLLAAAAVAIWSPAWSGTASLLAELLPGVLAASGAVLVALGVLELAARSRRVRRRAEFAHRPAFADHGWNGAFERYSAGPVVAGNLVRIAYLTPLIGVPLFFMWHAEVGFGVSKALVVAGIAVYSIGFVYTGWLALRWARHGQSEVRFGEFPFAPGRPARLTFVPGRALDGGPLRATLRYVEEAYESRRWFRRIEVTVVMYEVFAMRQELPLPAGGIAAGEQLGLEFALPDDPQLVTRLSDRPPSYWQFVVECATPGTDLHCLFFIPVYVESVVGRSGE